MTFQRLALITRSARVVLVYFKAFIFLRAVSVSTVNSSNAGKTVRVSHDLVLPETHNGLVLLMIGLKSGVSDFNQSQSKR